LLGYGSYLKYAKEQPLIPSVTTTKRFWTIYKNRTGLEELLDFFGKLKYFIQDMPEENYRQMKAVFSDPLFFKKDPIHILLDIWYTQRTLLEGMSAMLGYNFDKMKTPDVSEFDTERKLSETFEAMLVDQNGCIRLRNDALINNAMFLAGALQITPLGVGNSFLLRLLDDAQVYFSDAQQEIYADILLQKKYFLMDFIAKNEENKV